MGLPCQASFRPNVFMLPNINVMKRYIALFFSAAALLGLASCRDHLTGPPNPTPAVSDTVAYWTFDGNLKDVSGNGHDGSLNFGPGYGYAKNRFGTAGHALHFPDTLSDISGLVVSNTSGLNFTGNDSYTISAWVDIEQAWDFDIVRKQPVDKSRIGYRLGITQTSDSSGNTLSVADFQATDDTRGHFEMRGGRSIPANSWHLITAVVVAHQGVYLYIDSALDQYQPEPTMTPELNNDGPVTIEGHDCDLSDVLILNKAIDPVDVGSRFHESGWYERTDTVVTPPPGTDSSWTPVSAVTSDNLVIGQFVGSKIGFVGGEYGVVLATNDSGATWSVRGSAPIFTGSLTGNIYGLTFFDAQNGIVAGDQHDISVTADGGFTWQTIDASSLPQSDLIRSMCFTSGTTGFIGTSDYLAGPSGSICQTNDGGQTWNPIFYTNGGIYNIGFNSFTNNRSGVATGRDGVVYWTTDSGTSWHTGSSDEPNSVIYKTTFTSATTGFAVASAPLTGTPMTGYLLSTSDGGHSWTTIKTIAGGLIGIAANGAGTITAVGSGGTIVESTDGGTTWSQSIAGSNDWRCVLYLTPHRALLFGANGAIDVRER